MHYLPAARTQLAHTRVWHASLIHVGKSKFASRYAGPSAYHLVLTAYDFATKRRIKTVEERFYASSKTEACEKSNTFIRVMKRPHESIERDYYPTPNGRRTEWC